MSRSPEKLLLALARKDPTLQALLDSPDTPTPEQIANLDHPRWVKDRIKARGEERASHARAQALANKIPITTPLQEEYDVVEWVGGDEWLKGAGSTDYFVKAGQLLMLTPDGIWLGHILVKGLQVELARTKFVTRCTRRVYGGMHSK